METLIAASLTVFAITFIITKASITASKREFVKQRYAAAKLFSRPSWPHRFFNYFFTCPVCCGFWISLAVCYFLGHYGYCWDVLIVFGINWLWHCLESTLFWGGKFLEILSEVPKEENSEENSKNT